MQQALATKLSLDFALFCWFLGPFRGAKISAANKGDRGVNAQGREFTLSAFLRFRQSPRDLRRFPASEQTLCFWREQLGSERDLEGSFRTPEGLSPNREAAVGRKLLAERGKSKNAGRRTSRRFCLLAGKPFSVNDLRAPRLGLEPRT